MARWVAALFVCVISLTGTSCASNDVSTSEVTDSVRPYIYSFPTKYNSGFLSVAFSSDGSVVVGTTNEKDYWIWNQRTGSLFISNPIPNYQIIENSIGISADGNVVSGVYAVLWPNSNEKPVKIFRWTATTGMKFLPSLPAEDLVSKTDVSNDGNMISFLCVNSYNAACTGLPFPDTGAKYIFKTWSEVDGYENVGPDFGRNIDNQHYIHPSKNLKIFLVADLVLNGHIGLLHVDGSYTPFNPAPKYMFYADDIITNAENSVVAYNGLGPESQASIWRADGKSIKVKLPPKCVGFDVSAIDGNGVIYGVANCGGLTGVGFRVSPSETETVSKWLKDAGLSDDFPLNIIIVTVSDNGKTVQGYVTPAINISGDHAHTLAQPLLTRGPPGSEVGLGQGNAFIAHVP